MPEMTATQANGGNITAIGHLGESKGSSSVNVQRYLPSEKIEHNMLYSKVNQMRLKKIAGKELQQKLSDGNYKVKESAGRKTSRSRSRSRRKSQGRSKSRKSSGKKGSRRSNSRKGRKRSSSRKGRKRTTSRRRRSRRVKAADVD